MKEIKTSENRTYKRVSRWIKVKNEYVTKRHSLADYADFEENEKYGLLSYFIHNNRKYAIGQFSRLSHPEFFNNEDDKESFLCGYDNTDYWNPFHIEMTEDGEYVRLFIMTGDDNRE